MKLKCALMIIVYLLAAPSSANWQEGAGYLELVDRLDRSEDGYCLDIPGSGNWVEFNVPLIAHNCKLPGLYPDGAVTFDSPGPIRFPAFEGCATAAGLNGRSLPGATLMIKPCAGDTDLNRGPFVSKSLQLFRHLDDGRIELDGAGLCVAVGLVSDQTFSPDHRWRPLFLADCETIDLPRSVWKSFQPKATNNE